MDNSKLEEILKTKRAQNLSNKICSLMTKYADLTGDEWPKESAIVFAVYHKEYRWYKNISFVPKSIFNKAEEVK